MPNIKNVVKYITEISSQLIQNYKHNEYNKCILMKIKDISHLPVISGRGNLIRIIPKGDIFRALVHPKIHVSKY